MKTTKNVTVHGIEYTLTYGAEEGPAHPNQPMHYTAILSSRKYEGGDELVDNVLAKELARDEKITAGEIYRERPEVLVEEIIDLYHQESVGGEGFTYGVSDAEDVLPREATPTHLRYVMRRQLSGNYTIATRKIHDIQVSDIARRLLWTPEGGAMIA